MSQATAMTVRISGAVSAFGASNVGENGACEHIGEHVRDRIRRDKERVERKAFARLKAELTRAFAAPEKSIARCRRPRSSPGTGADDVALRVQVAAALRLDEICGYTRDRWGAEQADRDITDLFATFDPIENHGVASRLIPVAFGVEGFYVPHAHHVSRAGARATGE